MFDCFEEQKALVTELVNIRSAVGSDGCEQAIAEFVYGKLSSWDYFREHPENLLLVPTENDTIKRSSVVALVEGCSDERTGQAVLLLGHIDTVETSDYGSLEPLATKPGELLEALKNVCVSPELTADIESGRYMFGRGALDMKSGVASHMFILKYFSEHRDELNGSLIALFECDEEGDSHGMLTSVKTVKRLAKERGLRLKAAICADYSSKEAAIYLGTIGKYLPCVMAFGAGSHVGQVFSSLDPNLIISELTRAIDYNTDFCEEANGELSPPPVSLKQCDTKKSYSVQTAESAYAYFNWFSLKKSEEEILEICRAEAEKAAQRAIAKVNSGKAAYAGKIKALGGDPSKDESLKPAETPRVFTLKEYAEKLGFEIRTPDPFMDIRSFMVSEASRIRMEDPDRSPVVLVFMAGISYPPISVERSSELGQAAEKLGIPVRTYYPFISDTSFVSLLGDVPAVNLGTYGKDAHMYTERVDMDYSFRQLPNLSWKLLKTLLG